MLLTAINLIYLLIIKLMHHALKNHIGDQPNLWIGFRTPTTFKSTEIWLFAQRQSLKDFFKISMISLIIGIGWLIYDLLHFIQEMSIIIQAFLIIFISLIIVITTEIKVRKFAKTQQK
ncbi:MULTISPECIES: SdpI family protein [Staphylococcus]|uniref:SdpI family protein n=1 Tax=Staphylococcus schleiferi TaxID=1295 RepID=A0A7Z7QPB0_STASC|nr:MULTISPECIES: SdpI family protein [Staphylococcus]QGS45820.1 hypothetical protein FOB90_03580 [Mammaliicoccus fleurettii]EPD50420.1 hypothetical protein HMPREF1208_01299 [Staphylococcus sp. HGB0015]NHA33231.1 hypothetical protein [Staphylococcus schleiferi]NHA37613.1 hypothetical protein [Staphylococcus schleiferi]NHA40122.1 hypothetical protein [Staphylococcus schleiferi]